MKVSLKIILGMILVLTAAGSPKASRPTIFFAHAAGSGVNVDLNVHNCNNNGICESQYGENYPACPLDCTATSTSFAQPPTIAPTVAANQVLYDSDVDPLSIKIIYIDSGKVVIRWQTHGPAVNSLYWGKTSDTEIGSIAEINFVTDHRFEILNLKPNTLYFYRIESIDPYGHIRYLNNQYFVTPNMVVSFPNTPQISFGTIFNTVSNAVIVLAKEFTLISPNEIQPVNTMENKETIFGLRHFYFAHYYVAYFFGFLNFLISLLIHIW